MKELQQNLKDEIKKNPNQFNVIIAHMVVTEEGERRILKTETTKNTKYQTSQYIYRYINNKRIL